MKRNFAIFEEFFALATLGVKWLNEASSPNECSTDYKQSLFSLSDSQEKSDRSIM